MRFLKTNWAIAWSSIIRVSVEPKVTNTTKEWVILIAGFELTP